MNWILIASFVLGVFVYGKKGPTLVERLTDETFSKFIEENSVAMVNFFAPGCKSCKTLRPEYNKAAKMAKENNITIAFGNIDAVSQPTVAEKYDIEEYPTIKLFLDENPINYEGERTAEAIISFIREGLGPSSVEMNLDNAKSILADDSPMVRVDNKVGDTGDR